METNLKPIKHNKFLSKQSNTFKIKDSYRQKSIMQMVKDLQSFGKYFQKRTKTSSSSERSITHNSEETVWHN